MSKHPGAQSVYESLLKVHHWAVEQPEGSIPEWIDDELKDCLDLFVGWCSPMYSLAHLVDSSASFVKSEEK